MIRFRKYLVMNFVLAVLSLLALILQCMALADIAKQEVDVTLEWRVVGVCMIVVAVFVVVTIVTLVRVTILLNDGAGLAKQQKAD